VAINSTSVAILLFSIIKIIRRGHMFERPRLQNIDK